MDANFFRFLIKEGENYLIGVRIEKIYNPSQCLWTFKLSNKLNLIFSFGTKNNFLFFSTKRPENPLIASSTVRWWRKRIQKRWIKDVISVWPERKLTLQLSAREDFPCFLTLDLKRGLVLNEKLDELTEKKDIVWPDLKEIIENKKLFKIYPHITSPLRFFLLKIKSDFEKNTFYERLKKGEISTFYVCENNYSNGIEVYLWKKEEYDLERVVSFKSAMETAEYVGWKLLETALRKREDNSKKQKRLKKRLKKEREKLQKWIELESQGQLIKENLYRFDVNKHYKRIELIDSKGDKKSISLDPSKTLLENMKDIFKKVKKAKRGLVFLEKREKLLEKLPENQEPIFVERKKDNILFNKISIPSRIRGLKVKIFRSSDGFYIVRGKNNKTNHKLLSYGARSYDLWFHVENGPGAHVVVLKNTPNLEVPWRTIEEAGKLAAIASYQKESKKAKIIGTEIKYVKK